MNDLGLMYALQHNYAEAVKWYRDAPHRAAIVMRSTTSASVTTRVAASPKI